MQEAAKTSFALFDAYRSVSSSGNLF